MKHEIDVDMEGVGSASSVPNFQSNIPIPQKRGDLRKRKYHFDRMKVGEHVAYPADESTKIRPVVSYYKGKMNRGKSSADQKADFTSRIVGEQVIIWRIS